MSSFSNCVTRGLSLVVLALSVSTAVEASVVVDMPPPPSAAARADDAQRPATAVVAARESTTYERAVATQETASETAAPPSGQSVGDVALQRFTQARRGARNTYNLASTDRYARSNRRGHGYGYYYGSRYPCGPYGYGAFRFFHHGFFHHGFHGVGLSTTAPRGTVNNAPSRISHFRHFTPVRHAR